MTDLAQTIQSCAYHPEVLYNAKLSIIPANILKIQNQIGAEAKHQPWEIPRAVLVHLLTRVCFYLFILHLLTYLPLCCYPSVPVFHSIVMFHNSILLMMQVHYEPFSVADGLLTGPNKIDRR
jgi:hypothetical protein